MDSKISFGTKNLLIVLFGLVVVILVVAGVFYPSIVSKDYVRTERGAVEQGYLDIAMEDWRVVRPCFPIGYTKTVEVSAISCPSGEDQVIVESVCWFGAPGPRIQLCYKNAQSAEIGTGRPVILP